MYYLLVTPEPDVCAVETGYYINLTSHRHIFSGFRCIAILHINSYGGLVTFANVLIDNMFLLSISMTLM